MDNANDFMKIMSELPVPFFDILLQSVIHKSYMEFINVSNIDVKNLRHFLEKLHFKSVVFPDTLGILILNWHNEEFILKNKFPVLQTPVENFLDNSNKIPHGNLLRYRRYIAMHNVYNLNPLNFFNVNLT